MDIKVWLLKAFVWFTFLALPVHASMEAVLLLVTADLLTGIWAAHKRGEAITSWNLRRTVSKTLAYELAILLAYVLESNFMTFLPAAKIVSGFVAASEFKSCMENLTKITGLDFVTAVKGLIQGQKPNEEKLDVEKPIADADKGARGPTP